MTPRAISKTPHVLVLGGGFGGLSTVRGLAGARARVTLVDRRNHHLFQPLLYQVATASLAAPSIAAPLRQILRKQENVVVLLDEAVDVDLAARRVKCTHGSLDYDYLVVATGSTHAYFGHDDWEAFAPGLKTLSDAFRIRRRVLLAFEQAECEPDPDRRQQWLNFVVVGGGSTGVELAGTLIELARRTLPREFRRCDPRQATVHLVEAGSRLLSGFPTTLSTKACRQLEHLGVQLHLGSGVTAVDAEGVAMGARRLEARTVLWAAGVAASPIGRRLGATLDRAGRVGVEPDLSLPGYPEVFVIGDLATVQQAGGQRVPGVAPAAKQMGQYVGANLCARLTGTPVPGPFRYHDAGSLATIGRSAAVARIGKLRLSGFPAWVVWLLAHLYFLIGFRNRLVVMLDWASASHQPPPRAHRQWRRGPPRMTATVGRRAAAAASG